MTSDYGKLISEENEYGDTLTYSYNNDGSLHDVTDTLNRTTSFSYTTNSENEPVVSSIQTYDNKTISLYYNSDDSLSYIQLSDGGISRFTYDDGLLVSVKEEMTNPSLSGQAVTFDYDNVGRVETMTEKGTDNTTGNYIEISYGDDNTTTFTDRQGRESTYTFDNAGNLITVLNANGYLESNSSDSTGFTISGGTESFTKNYITCPVDPTTGYYYQVNGIKDNTTSSGGEFTINDAAPTEENGKTQFIGNTSIKIHNPVLTGDAAFYTCAAHSFTSSAFQGKDVTFSAYVKTKNIQQIYTGGAVGASLRINCLDNSGNSLAVEDSIGFAGTQDWQRLSVSCTVPSNTTNIVIYCMNRYASGTAWFDCLQFEIGNSASDFNALQNSDFGGNSNWNTEENSSASIQNSSITIDGVSGTYDNSSVEEEPTESETEAEIETYYVETSETEPYGYVSTYDDYGNLIKSEQGMVTRSVKKTYEVTEDEGLAGTGALSEDEEAQDLGNKYVYQNVDIGRAGVIFNISGEAQANSVPLTNEKRTFGIALVINYDDPNEEPEQHYQEFNAFTPHTQTTSMTVYPEKTEKVIESVAFAFVYSYNENTMTVTNSMLNIALSSYSSSGTTASSEGGEGTGGEEEEDNYIDYEVTSESVDKTQTYMGSSKTYDSSHNYVVSEIDESGKEVTYTYDTSGNTTSITDSDENTYEYAYDSANRITEISYEEEASTTYAYNNAAGNVTSIEHNDFAYTFNYNVFNKLISSKIGNVTVASNTYSANNGNLLRTDYANGDYITYEYDDYDNVIEMGGENGTIAQFVYNKKGMISKCIDELSDTTTYYYYDFAGNVTGEYRQSEDGSLSYHVGYDSDGNTVQNTDVNGQTKVVTSGVDSDGNSFTNYDGVTVNSTSDDFGRTTQVETAKDGISNSFYTEYEYADGSAANSTTNLISSITQKYGENQLVSYAYSYNDNGDVYSVYENGTKKAEYRYGSMNQLSQWFDSNTQLYKVFMYDDAGNVTKVSDYSFNPSSNSWHPSTFIEEHTYTYGDNNWQDKLTKFDNQTITYDANGNPLQYRDGMSFTWVNGRTLDTVTVNNDTINMQYDYNGMRTQKGDTQYYYDSSNDLIGMVKGSHTLLFYYDENNSPTAFTDNGTMYFYIKNLQGDIVKIVNRSGSVIVNYTYDALGKKLSVKDAANNEITDLNNLALLNPLRYRGYVYDDETGLYYLQSRYYDPTIGRFINADSCFDTVSGTPLSANMFAYCENNPISKFDPTGNDAWWLQDTSNVSYLGHTSLLIQEAPGHWWYFYWGDYSIQLIYIGTCTLDELNKYLISNNLYSSLSLKNYETKFNRIFWFKGNFRPCISYIFHNLLNYNARRTYSRNHRYIKNFFPYRNPQYNVAFKNCMQVSCKVLLYGSFSNSSYKSALYYLAQLCVPNYAFTELLFFDSLIRSGIPSWIALLSLSYTTSHYSLRRGVNIYNW